MNLHALVSAGRQPSLPWVVTNVEHDTLRIVRWLRVLPGQRYVGQAEWRGRSVLAKLLVGPKAERHFRREYQGACWLAEQSISTPLLLAHGFHRTEGGWLLFEYLDSAHSLNDEWQPMAHEVPLSAPQQSVLHEALVLIAQLHRCGLWQRDLHLDNLLRYQNRLYLVDGGGVEAETPGQPLSSKAVLENLSVFFAQLPPAFDSFIPALLSVYLHVNPVSWGEQSLTEQVRQVRQRRLISFLKKAGRDCSLFSVQRGLHGLRAAWRATLPMIQPLVDSPDDFIERGHIYKTGGAATVARVDFQGQFWIIKRYNIKNRWHWLKRFWRPSRAWHSWREAHRLQLLGLATPHPFAVREQRCWGLRGPAWLITEYLPGSDILALFNPYLDTSPPEHLMQALDRLFAALVRERISHGDLKGHNLLWDDRIGQWSLIDLDAMRQHRCAGRFIRAYRHDRARFLRNWPRDSSLYRLLDQRLPRL